AGPRLHSHSKARVLQEAIRYASNVSEFRRDIPTEVVTNRKEGLRLTAIFKGGTVEHELPSRGQITIGRTGRVDSVVDEQSAARLHARRTIDKEITVCDLGSSNGTWIEGQRIEPGRQVVVPPSGVIEVGSVLVVVRGGARPDALTNPGGAGTSPGIVV